jgi:hypothetical protein
MGSLIDVSTSRTFVYDNHILRFRVHKLHSVYIEICSTYRALFYTSRQTRTHFLIRSFSLSAIMSVLVALQLELTSSPLPGGLLGLCLLLGARPCLCPWELGSWHYCQGSSRRRRQPPWPNPGNVTEPYTWRGKASGQTHGNKLLGVISTAT